MKDLTQIVCDNIIRYSKKLGFKNSNIASYLNVDDSTVSKYLSGHRKIPIVTLEEIAVLFGIEMIDLFEKDSDLSKIKLECAFRADSNDVDLKAAAFLKEKALNYINMKKMLSNA